MARPIAPEMQSRKYGVKVGREEFVFAFGDLPEVALRRLPFEQVYNAERDNMAQAVNMVEEDLARQVTRHREKRRGRRAAAKAEPRPLAP